MLSLESSFVLGQRAHEGTGSGSHCGATSQPQGSGFWSQGQAAPVTTGSSSQPQGVCEIIGCCSHGQAAITVLNEHVAIPTAIAAATVSFLIVILTSFLR